jgi:large subunit ribosomal protein L23
VASLDGLARKLHKRTAMAQKILIRPIITEKATRLAENPKLNQYTFEVARSANKIEVRNAVEKQFGVTVLSVNTSICPGKNRSRVVKGKQTHGRKSAIKKAIVTVKEGQFIEGFYGNAEEAIEPETNDEEAVNA